ncbi:hypothetical protein OIV83_005319 [Microbotryomycetes sp. JL201]|nr:hypothetical protein OIV83_005319 [Microbotryomycetes sp. JL201]
MPGFKLSTLFRADRRASLRKRRTSLGHSAASTPHGVVRPKHASLHRIRSPLVQPSLPPEIILHIFELAASSDRDNGTAEALGALVKISVLSTATRAWAIDRIYRHVTLTEPASAHMLVKTLKNSRQLAIRVHSLTLDGTATDLKTGARLRRTMTARMDSLLALCPMLSSITIKNATIFALTDFSNGRNVRRLQLENVAIADRTTTNRFNPFFVILPDLEHLVLRDTYFDQVTANHFLCPTTLPRLQSLELDGCRLIDDLTQFRVTGQYEPVLVARQLSLLVLNDDEDRPGAGHATADDWRPMSHFVDKCRSLRALSIPSGAASQAVFNTVAHTLEYLDVRIRASSTRQSRHPTEEDHIQACGALSSTLSALPGTTESVTPPDSYFMLSRSPSPSAYDSSTPTTPLDWLRSSPEPSARVLNGLLPLSQLTHLTVPKEWRHYAGKVGSSSRGEMARHVDRLERACEARDILLQYQ